MAPEGRPGCARHWLREAGGSPLLRALVIHRAQVGRGVIGLLLWCMRVCAVGSWVWASSLVGTCPFKSAPAGAGAASPLLQHVCPSDHQQPCPPVQGLHPCAAASPHHTHGECRRPRQQQGTGVAWGMNRHGQPGLRDVLGLWMHYCRLDPRALHPPAIRLV